MPSIAILDASNDRAVGVIEARGIQEFRVSPGSGSPELLARAEELGLSTVEAFSIVAAGDTMAWNSPGSDRVGGVRLGRP